MRVRVEVDNRVRVRVVDLDAETLHSLKEPFEHANPQHALLRAIGKSTWSEPEKIVTWKKEPRGGEPWLSLPRGGLARLRAVLEAHRIEREVVDRRHGGAADVRREDVPAHLVELRDYQREMVEAGVLREQGVMRTPTGGGKTTAAFALIARLGVPSLVLVPSLALMREVWLPRAKKEFGLAERDVGIIHGGRCDLRPLTLSLPQTIAARGVSEELATYFGCVLCDEAQSFAAKTFFAAVDPWPARYRFAMSADERRKDKKEFLVHDLFGARILDVPRERLISEGWILDVEVRVVPTGFRADWYGFGGAEEDSESGERDKQIDFNRLLDEMAADEERNRLVLDLVAREVREHQSRVIVFAHRREHCLSFDRTLDAHRFRTGFLIGGDDYRVQFARTVEGLQQGTLDVGVGTYRGSGTGIDIPALGVGIAATPIAANEFFFGQVRGRLCRPGSTDARLYYLWDRHVYGAKHLENICRWNARVVVRQGERWVDARAYLRDMKKRSRHKRQSW